MWRLVPSGVVATAHREIRTADPVDAWFGCNMENTFRNNTCLDDSISPEFSIFSEKFALAGTVRTVLTTAE